LSQGCFVRSPPGTASGKLAVDNDDRQAPNAVLLCPCGDVRLLHVVNFDVMGGTGKAPHHVDGLATGRTTSTENLDLPPLSLSHQ